MSKTEKAMSLCGARSGLPQLQTRTETVRKVRTTVPYEGVDLLIGESGIEAAEPITVGKMFQDTVAKYPAHPALRYKEGGEWKTITYSEYYNLSIKAAKAFLKVSWNFEGITKCSSWIFEVELAELVPSHDPPWIETTAVRAQLATSIPILFHNAAASAMEFIPIGKNSTSSVIC